MLTGVSYFIQNSFAQETHDLEESKLEWSLNMYKLGKKASSSNVNPILFLGLPLSLTMR
jgi:hypothetical protein